MCLFKGSFSAVIRGPVSGPITDPPGCPELSPSHVPGYSPSSTFSHPSSSPEAGRQGKSQKSASPLGEVKALKEQLEALQCQVGCSLQYSFNMCSLFWCDEKNLMSTHCCRGKICLMLEPELDGELLHQVVAVCCFSQSIMKHLHITSVDIGSLPYWCPVSTDPDLWRRISDRA